MAEGQQKFIKFISENEISMESNLSESLFFGAMLVYQRREDFKSWLCQDHLLYLMLQ